MKRLKTAVTTSWRTTASGIAAFVVIALQAFRLLVDGDPSTNPDWNLVVAELMLMIGLLNAQEHQDA